MDKKKYKNLIYQTPTGLIVATIVASEWSGLLRLTRARGYSDEVVKEAFIDLIWSQGLEYTEIPQKYFQLCLFLDDWFENILAKYALQINRGYF